VDRKVVLRGQVDDAAGQRVPGQEVDPLDVLDRDPPHLLTVDPQDLLVGL